jgi:uracil-DNA glycosylase
VTPPIFDLNCRQCPRLSTFLDDNKIQYPDYHARPVAPFGVDKPALLIVGLAPGMHGANATGRPFTGDHAGVLLYQTMYDHGFSSSPESHADDDLQLINCRITNAVKCLPPQNKPTGEEIRGCNHFLQAELATLGEGACVLALGTIAHNAVLRALGVKLKDYPFGHDVLAKIENAPARAAPLYLLDSYHCSRYNTQTRRLTETMFQAVFAHARELVKAQQR